MVMSNAHRVIAGMFILMYALPAAGHAWFCDQIISSYHQFPLTFAGILQLGAVYGLFLFLYTTGVPVLPTLRTVRFSRVLTRLSTMYFKMRLPLGLLAVGLGVLAASSGVNSFRYGSEGISERESWAVALIAAFAIGQLCLHADAFYRMFVGMPPAQSTPRWYWENLLLSAGLVSLANGIMSLLVGILALSHALMPNIVGKMFFREENRKHLHGLLVNSGWIAAFAVIFCAALYFGSIIKVSSSKDATELFTENPLEVAGYVAEVVDEPITVWAIKHFLERASIYYYSWTFTTVVGWEDLNQDGWIVGVPLKNLFFRLDYFMGRPMAIERPETGSLAQLNYQRLTAGEVRSRVGSTPGFLGAFNYALPVPLNILFCAFYLRWWCRQFDALFFAQREKRLTTFGILVTYVMLAGLFQSPFDWLQILDEGIVLPVLLWAMAVAHRHQKLLSAADNAARPMNMPAWSQVRVNPA